MVILAEYGIFNIVKTQEIQMQSLFGLLHGNVVWFSLYVYDLHYFASQSQIFPPWLELVMVYLVFMEVKSLISQGWCFKYYEGG